MNTAGELELPEAAAGSMSFVLVPGGWSGGWAYEAVTPLLTELGHAVHTLAPAGIAAEDVGGLNLDTHIEQVVELVRAAAAPVVLVGHSYGGMVITGAADRAPEAVARLVYVDAYVPESEESCWRLTSEKYRTLFTDGAAGDGHTVAVPAGLDPRARPHPVACFLQALHLQQPEALARIPRTFVSGGPWRGTPFTELATRLRGRRGWEVRDLPVGHDIMNRDPAGLARILTSPATPPEEDEQCP